MLVVGSIPFAVLLVTHGHSMEHYASPNVMSVFGAFWAILAIGIILDKGTDSMVSKDAIDIVWSLIGLSNLIGVVLFFFSYVNS
jgi:hypothetical protein